jgi:hypothetical protein
LLFASIDDQADLVPPHELPIINGCAVDKQNGGDTFLAKYRRDYVVHISRPVVERQNKRARGSLVVATQRELFQL